MDRHVPRPGERYVHFKGNQYQILCVAKHSETGEQMVVYQALYGEFACYARPLWMFMGGVDRGKYPESGQRYRFELVTAEENEVQAETVRDAGCGNMADAGMRGNASGTGVRGSVSDAGMRSSASGAGVRSNASGAGVRSSTSGAGARGSMSDAGMRSSTSGAGVRGSASDAGMRWTDMTREAAYEEKMYAEGMGENRQAAAQEEEEQADPALLRFLDADTLEQKYQVLKTLEGTITNRLIDDFAVALDLVIPEGDVDSRYFELLSSVRTMQRFENTRFR